MDDVVLIKNPAKPRPFWLLGRVLELHHGDDDKVRSAKIKRGDGAEQVHSLKHLYPLELSLTHAHNPISPMDESDIDENDFEGPHVSNMLNLPGDSLPNSNTSISNVQISQPDAMSDSNIQMSQPDVMADSNAQINDENTSNSQAKNQNSQRPKRAAAMKGKNQNKNDPYYYY